jgi:putative toxin-antitoxin system antitoxin component (TIGR02293 family)
MAPTSREPKFLRFRRLLSGKPHPRTADIQIFIQTLGEGLSAETTYTTLLGMKERDPIELVRMVREGLSFKVVKRFQRNMDLSLTDVADLIQVPARTLTRRQEEGRLGSDESDRLLRASRLFAKAIELFEGDVEGARAWLSTSQPSFGGAKPLDLATTEVGTREVESLIGRLEHGIPS